MKKTCVVFALCLGPLIIPAPVLAIDIQPEDGIAPKPGVTAVQFGYTNSQRGSYYVNGVKQSAATEFDLSQAHVRIAHSFEWAGRPSVAYLQVPHGAINTKNAGARDAPTNTGDATLMLGTWLIADHVAHRFLGLGGYLFLPTGDYDVRYTQNALNTNLGENRYRGALQVGYHERIFGNLGWQLALDTTWYGDNDEFLKNTTDKVRLGRNPLYAGQTSLAYRIQPNIGIGASYFYTEGGKTRKNGVEDNNRVAVQRYQFTGFYHFTSSRITLQYGGDIKTENGFKEDRHVIVRWTQYF